MGRLQAAQAQAQHQTAISHTESLELVRCLLRVSIFHVSYLRGLFPEKSFRGVDMKNLDDMHIKMLLPVCDESRRLVDWVEGGVYDAIKRGYLKNLFFGISTDPEGTQLLEEYIFTFRYGVDGRVVMDMAAAAAAGAEGAARGGKGARGEFKQEGGKGGGGADLATVRYQVCRLIRMLVQVCRTLDRVPAERYLFMKLTYQDHTPEEYEPPYFVPVDESGVGHFKRAPFNISVGKVNTDHHCVTLKVKSTLDSCDDEDGGGEGGEGGEAAAAPAGTNEGGVAADPGTAAKGPPGVAAAAAAATAAAEQADRVTAKAQPSVSVASGTAGGRTTTTTGGGGSGGEDRGDHGTDDVRQLAEDDDPRRRAKADVDALLSEPQPGDLGAGAGAGDAMQTDEPEEHEEEGVQEQQGDKEEGADGGMGMDVDGGEGAAKADTDVTEPPQCEDLAAVRGFALDSIKAEGKVSMRQLSKRFSSLGQEALGGFVGALVAQGVLAGVPGARNAYRDGPAAANGNANASQQAAEGQSLPMAMPTLAPPPPTQPATAAAVAAIPATRRSQRNAAATQPPSQLPATVPIAPTANGNGHNGKAADATDAIVQQMDGLTVGAAARREGGRGRKGEDDLRRSRDQQLPGGGDGQQLGSRGGRVDTQLAGDDVTGSPPDAPQQPPQQLADGAKAKGRGSKRGSDEQPDVYIADSQASGRERRATRARKASYVADPIQQGTAPKKAKKGAGDQGQGQGQQGGDADMATTPRGKTAATPPGKGATPTPGRRGVSRLAGMRR